MAGPVGLDLGQCCVRVFVAGAGTIPQFGNCVGRIAELLVIARFVVAGMAGSAIGRVGSKFVRHGLRIARVAIETRKRARVRSGVGGRRMDIVGGRDPGRNPVAILTGDCRLEVRRWLARGLCAVVAGAASARNVGVIERRGQPGDRLVAIAAICRGRNVCRGLTGGLRAVVACSAGAKRLSVVHSHCRPCGGDMAAVATVCRRNMRGGLARDGGSVVATYASSIGVDMVERGGNPCR